MTTPNTHTHAAHARLGRPLCHGEGEATPHALLVTCPKCQKLLTAQQLARRKNSSQGG